MLTLRKMSSSGRTSSENTVSAETTSIATKVNEVIPSSSALTVSLTCNFGDLPTWLQDNHDILKGYRRPTFSYVKCAKSLFYIHNESGKLMTIFVIRNHTF
jgi:hypothetical protein